MAVAGELQALPFGTLIGAPLDAAIDAQAKAAVSSVKFIKAIGFNDDNTPQNITFTATKDNVASEITVPLLTIVPIPFIRIDEMTIDFKANVSSSTASEDSTTASSVKSGQISASARYLFFKAELKGSISSKKDSSSTKNSKYAVETTIDIHVHAVQDELPAGLSKMLEILTDTISGQAGGETGQETGDKQQKKKKPAGQ